MPTSPHRRGGVGSEPCAKVGTGSPGAAREAALVVGLGIDLVEVDRVRRSWARFGSRLVGRLMDPEEASCLPGDEPGRVLALAHAIAVKEATSKALGTGWSRGVHWRDVVVSRHGDERPGVRLDAEALAVARRRGSPGVVVAWARGGADSRLVLAEARLLS